MNRLDRALHIRGFAKSRTEARELIEASLVAIGGRVATKPSELVSDEAEIVVLGSCRSFVSRGGLKLQAALDGFGIDVAGRVALDVGASTGGFTDCLLQRGASRVLAIDVGHGQLASTLLSDPRVELREGVNARNLKPGDLGGAFDLIVVDVSFISLRLIVPPLAPLLNPTGDLLCLVKPQFEVGAAAIGKGGVVRSAEARQRALDAIVAAGASCGLVEQGRMTSPIEGGDGNIEFLLSLQIGNSQQGMPTI